MKLIITSRVRLIISLLIVVGGLAYGVSNIIGNINPLAPTDNTTTEKKVVTKDTTTKQTTKVVPVKKDGVKVVDTTTKKITPTLVVTPPVKAPVVVNKVVTKPVVKTVVPKKKDTDFTVNPVPTKKTKLNKDSIQTVKAKTDTVKVKSTLNAKF